MAIKKSDLYSSIWASCDELRGGMDASQYKDYVLFMLFIIAEIAIKSKAGKLGTAILFFVLAFGMVGYMAKGIIQKMWGI